MENSHFSSPEDAENALYEALSNGDRVLLGRVWTDEATAMLVNASGEIITDGTAIVVAISKSFEGRGPLIYRLSSNAKWQHQKISVHSLEESIYIEGDRRRQSYIVTTNVFIDTGNGWRLSVRQMTPGSVTKSIKTERRELPDSLVRNLDVFGLLR